MDKTNEVDEDQATYYQSQIGILHWIVELGHLQTVFHIYAYLKKRHNSRLPLDPSHPEIDMRGFHQADWTDFYGVSRRQYLTMPQSQGESQSFCELLWTLIMQMIKSEEGLEQDSVSLSIWLALFGI